MEQSTQDIQQIISKIFPESTDYVIFGAGNWGIKCMQFLKRNGYTIEVIIDNDSQKWGEIYDGVTVESPNYLMEKQKNIIIANLYYKEEIQKQLESMGFARNINYIYIEDILSMLV